MITDASHITDHAFRFEGGQPWWTRCSVCGLSEAAHAQSVPYTPDLGPLAKHRHPTDGAYRWDLDCPACFTEAHRPKRSGAVGQPHPDWRPGDGLDWKPEAHS